MFHILYAVLASFNKWLKFFIWVVFGSFLEFTSFIQMLRNSGSINFKIP